jgi:XTP/dITP diphosphohydrolase
MQKIKLVLATNNSHKVEEILNCIGDKFEILTLKDIGFEGDIDETGLTLEENSLLKANFIFDKYKVNCLADDSGLEVNALDGAPGVYSARYSGTHGDHEANMDLLLKNLLNQKDRSAQFRTVITLILEGKPTQFAGFIKGKIISERLGNQGFGYDPIFVPEGFESTFAQMTLIEKNNLSHRSRAINKMVEYLEAL